MLSKIKPSISKKLYVMRNKSSRRNGSSQEDIQIYLRTLFDRTRSFRFNCKNVIKNEKFYFALNLCEIRKKCQERKLFDSKRSAN